MTQVDARNTEPKVKASPFMLPGEVAERFGTTAETVRRWVREDRLPSKAIVTLPSGRIKFRRAEIDALMPAERSS